MTETELRQDIERTRELGYAFSDEDVTIGVCSVGVPLFRGDSPYAVASLSLGGFIDYVKPNRDRLAETLRRYADRLMTGL